MQRRLRIGRVAEIVLVLLALGALRPARAQPGGAIVGEAVRVSGPSPLPPGCLGAPLASRVYRDTVVEPSLAVDPSNPLHLVGAWQQDRIATAGSSAQIAAVSWDGGRAWSTSAATFARCQGGTAAAGTYYERISDPWVTIAPNGDVYQMTIAFDNPSAAGARNAMLVSKSTDGGLTWSPPVTLIGEAVADAFNDKNSITADPYDANYVYAVWHRELPALENDETPYVAPAMVARTTDGGQTWEAPRVMVAAPGAAASGNTVLVLPSGDLVDVFALNYQEGGRQVSDLAVVRSGDRGVTWSEPVVVARMGTVDLFDRYSTFTIRPTPDNIPTAAVDRRTGRLYVSWTSGAFSDGRRSDIALATSDDGGLTWTAPTRINRTPGDAHAFIPTLAVLDDGTVGTAYVDLRSNRPDQLGILADHWLAYCRAGCSDPSVWQEAHVAGPFDMERAPYARGFFVGDYMGVAAQADAFALLYVTTTPPADPEPTAAFFVAVRPN